MLSLRPCPTTKLFSADMYCANELQSIVIDRKSYYFALFTLKKFNGYLRLTIGQCRCEYCILKRRASPQEALVSSDFPAVRRLNHGTQRTETVVYCNLNKCIQRLKRMHLSFCYLLYMNLLQ